jgi:dipeptidyl aminopeptidase/acylaminoacyl peptidase
MLRSSRVVPLLALLAAPITAQQPRVDAAAPAASGSTKVRRPLTEADYGKIEALGSTSLSPDGKWVAYDFRRTSGGGELRYRALATDAEITVRNGSGPVFSNNNRWLVYTIGVDSSAGGRAGRGGAGRGGNATAAVGPQARNRVGVADLRSGATTDFGDVQSFALSKDGAYIALRRYPPTGRRTADLVVRDLEQKTDVTFGNVSEFAWNENAPLLAMTIDVEGKTGNAVQLFDAATGAIRSLDAGDVSYTNLLWRAKSNDLAAFRVRMDTAFIDTSYAVIAWRGLSTPRATKVVYDFATDASFPKEMRVASYRRPVWSDDGGLLFFGIARREPKPSPPARGGPQPARVQVWHWKDLRQYHQQEVQAAQDRQRTHLVVWHLAPNKLIRLADDSIDDVQLSRRGVAALATDENPYIKEIMSGRSYRDLYSVDLASGKRTRIATKVLAGGSVSPSGRFVAYTQGGHWWIYDATTGAKKNLTEAIKTSFVDMEDDHPVPERRGYGLAGWTGDQALLLYDRFDLWKVNVDGSNPQRLTRGAEDSTVYRYVAVDDDEAPAPGGFGGGRGGAGGGAPAIDLTKPITLSAFGDYSKKSGYARLAPGQPVRRLLFVDKSITRLDKARDADVYSYVAQTYAESPDVFVGSSGLTDAKQISHTNAFLAEYAWGKQDLLNYTNSRGDKLQMMLTYPADYQPGTQYPMVVYYYEKLSQGFHQFVVPTDRAVYNTSVFSQNGYFVLRPDILFRARDPGYSGLDCVTSAVKAVLAMGMVDPKRVGNMGHSWGGYQSAFYAVHNPGLFAATIAGAPLTNLISMYGYTSGNSGLPETGHFETGQERMQVPLWEDPQAYIRNSTVFSMDSLKTPLLLEEGSIDGNVNSFQSQELYNFGRRLGKQVVYLVYEDENHNVARPESQRDYHRRQLDWFGHFLKGEPAADWIVSGETYQARQKILKDAGGQEAAGGRGGRPPTP